MMQTVHQTQADVEAEADRLRRRARIKCLRAEMLEDQASDLEMRALDLDQIAGDLADKEELETLGMPS